MSAPLILATSATSRSRPVPFLVAVVTTTVWAAIVTVAPVIALTVLVWAIDTRSTASAIDAVRIAVDGWLLAHGVQLSISDGVSDGAIGLAPLLFTFFICWQIARAAMSATRATGAVRLSALIRIVVGVAFVYALVGAGAALFARTDAVRAAPWLAAIITGLLAAACSAIGVGLSSGRGIAQWRRLPAVVRSGLRGGLAASCLVVAFGALVAAVGFVLSADQARELFVVLTPGLVGGIVLGLICLFYTPTVALWGAAYLVGPGFAIGENTTVNPLDVSLGPVPALPLFAGLPYTQGGALAVLLLSVVPIIGVATGVLIARVPGLSWRETWYAAGLSGLTAGILLAVAMVTAAGPLGGGRLTAVGPSSWQVGLLATFEIAAPAVISATIARWWGAAQPPVDRAFHLL